jgi:phosphate/sulfate permease
LGVARNVMVAWIITIPASETVAAAIYGLTTFLGLIQLSR